MFQEHAWSTFLCLNVFERFWSHLIHFLLFPMVSDNFSWTNPTALKKKMDRHLRQHTGVRQCGSGPGSGFFRARNLVQQNALHKYV